MKTEDDQRTTAAGYDRWAALYNDKDPSTALDEPFVLEHLKPFPGCNILDVGCGTGRYLRQLIPGLYRIIAVDLSRGMLTRAQRQTNMRTDISFFQASAISLPFLPCSFDRVLCGLVLDHIALPKQLFEAIATVLRKNGHAIVAAVHPDMQRITGADIDVGSEAEPVRIPGHIHEVGDLVAAAGDAHLTVVAVEEPRVTPAMIERSPSWQRKLGQPGLLLLALVNGK